MATSRKRRKYDDMPTWKKLSIVLPVLLIVVAALGNIASNVFGNKMKPACRAEITALSEWMTTHGDWSQVQNTSIAVRLARMEQDIKHLKEQSDRIYKIVLEVRTNGNGRKK